MHHRFQSTFPRRERPERGRPPPLWECFNPRSREGNDRKKPDRFTALVSFNPRSREGNDAIVRIEAADYKVSIHVPAKGTTVYWHHSCMFIAVSIHVPAKGTTIFVSHRFKFIYVSIHVPAKGTTSLICRSMTYRIRFNPRSREGNDPSR